MLHGGRTQSHTVQRLHQRHVLQRDVPWRGFRAFPQVRVSHHGICDGEFAVGRHAHFVPCGTVGAVRFWIVGGADRLPMYEADHSDHNLFAMDYSSGEVGAKERYGPVYTMQTAAPTPFTKLVVSDLQKACMLLCKEDNGGEWPIEENFNRLVKIMDRHFHSTLVSRMVLGGVERTIDYSVKPNNQEITLGLYPFRLLLNHACVPNIASSTYGNKLVFTVIRPIMAGQQIFDCYLYVLI